MSLMGLNNLSPRYSGFKRKNLSSETDIEKENNSIKTSRTNKRSVNLLSKNPYFVNELPQLIQKANEVLKTVSFSPGYELQERCYPSSEDFLPIINVVNEIRKSCVHFHSNEQLIDPNEINILFRKQFSTFLKGWMNRVKEVALESRQKELKKVEEEDRPRVLAHIDALETNPERPLLQLRELLNAQRIPKSHGGSGRDATMDEISLFRFLWKHKEALSSSEKTTDNSPSPMIIRERLFIEDEISSSPSSTGKASSLSSTSNDDWLKFDEDFSSSPSSSSTAE